MGATEQQKKELREKLLKEPPVGRPFRHVVCENGIEGYIAFSDEEIAQQAIDAAYFEEQKKNQPLTLEERIAKLEKAAGIGGT